MNTTLKKVTYFITIILVVSCATNKVTTNTTEVNTNLNSKYRKSRKAYTGTLNKSEYDELIKMLTIELETTMPTDKAILINYNQKAPNCITFRLNEYDYEQITINGIRISSQMSSDHDAIDFFVYTKDSFYKEIYERVTEYILDSGFFYENIFTEHQNCEAFIIIKPNGAFLKYYGEDYYSKVQAFLEKETKN